MGRARFVAPVGVAYNAARGVRDERSTLPRLTPISAARTWIDREDVGHREHDGQGVCWPQQNETSRRKIPLNGAARDAIRMLKRADELGHTDPGH